MGNRMNPRRDSNPSPDQPAVYSVHRQQNEWRFSRRGFVSAAGLASAALLAHLGRHPEAQALAVEALPEPSDNALMALEPGQPFEKHWHLRNNGTQPWGDDAELRLTDPAGLRAPASYRLPNLKPSESISLRIDCVAPEAPGVSQSQWRVAANGVLSRPLYLPILVQGDGEYPTLTPTQTPDTTPWPPGTCIIETEHPYKKPQEWYVTNPDPGGWGTKLHLPKLDLDRGSSVYFYSSDSEKHSCFYRESDNGVDLWTEPIQGRVVRISLAGNSIPATGWGFCVDDISSVVAQPTATPTSTPRPTRTPCASHSSCTSDFPCLCNPRFCACDRICTCDGICTCNVIRYEQQRR